MKNYKELKEKLASGWNTWNTRSVLSHVLLPHGFAINLGFKEHKDARVLKETLIGRFGDSDERIHPGGHAYDGSYTGLNLKWCDMEFDIESATVKDDLVILIQPVKVQKCSPLLIVELGMLWNRPGHICKHNDYFSVDIEDASLSLHYTGTTIDEPNIPCLTPYVCVKLDTAVGVSTGKPRSVDEISRIISDNKKAYEQSNEQYGSLSEPYHAMQTCLAWDTIYEPSKNRVISPVSRIWSVNACGYVLFCWDTYFAAYMAFDNRELAYSNAIEITRAKTVDGFIPNFDKPDCNSVDRSQPPVGSMIIKELYRRYKETWLLEEVFDDLYEWNTWFYNNRRLEEGLMAWGSNPREIITGNRWEYAGVNDTFGAALESGLDNSPMYDNMPFDNERHMLLLADVGLMGLYIMDCKALKDIAKVLGHADVINELSSREKEISEGMQRLWNKDFGMFLNRNIKENKFSYRLSPTNFYSLFADDISAEQIQDMIEKHFYNPEEFWGEYIMPSIARNDPEYPDQDYWRGRIWAPLNFLTYLAMRTCGLNKPRKDLVKKSIELFMKEWNDHGHVHENYNGTTGEGCDVRNSDKFYHWGALLVLMALIEEGYLEGLEQEL